MNAESDGFGRLARAYRALEYAAFGGQLERVRLEFAPRLGAARRVLVLGDGDGRFLVRLLALNPLCEVTAIDVSPGMLAAAAARLRASDRARVRFIRADARACRFPPRSHDAVVTLFFLDCFSQEDAEQLIRMLADSLETRGLWLWADFTLPPSGWRRWRARVWLAVLYTFFRMATGLSTTRLPDVGTAFEAAGLKLVVSRSRCAGLLGAALLRRGAAEP